MNLPHSTNHHPKKTTDTQEIEMIHRTALARERAYIIIEKIPQISQKRSLLKVLQKADQTEARRWAKQNTKSKTKLEKN